MQNGSVIYTVYSNIYEKIKKLKLTRATNARALYYIVLYMYYTFSCIPWKPPYRDITSCLGPFWPKHFYSLQRRK